MGSSFSASKAKQKVRQFEMEVEKFSGTASSRRYKTLEREIVKTNEKTLALLRNSKKPEECKEVLRKLDNCLQRLSVKGTSSNAAAPPYSHAKDNSAFVKLEAHVKPAKTGKVASDKMEVHIAQPKPAKAFDKVEVHVEQPKTGKIEDKHKNVYPPIPKSIAPETPATYKNIYPPVPADDIENYFGGNENEEQLNILPPVPMYSNGQFDKIEVVEDIDKRNYENEAAYNVYPPVPLTDKLRIFPPVVKT